MKLTPPLSVQVLIAGKISFQQKPFCYKYPHPRNLNQLYFQSPHKCRKICIFRKAALYEEICWKKADSKTGTWMDNPKKKKKKTQLFSRRRLEIVLLLLMRQTAYCGIFLFLSATCFPCFRFIPGKILPAVQSYTQGGAIPPQMESCLQFRFNGL